MLFKSIFSFMLGLCLSMLLPAHPPNSQVDFSFYTASISIAYSNEILIDQKIIFKEDQLVAFYDKLDQAPHRSVLKTIINTKNKYRLNDWLTYELVKRTVDKIYTRKSRNYKVLVTWFLMSKLDYDTRLAFMKNTAYLYVQTNDNIYETPMIEEKGRMYLGLTEIQYKRTNKDQAIYLLNFIARPNGQPFSLDFNLLPLLEPNLQQKTFVFEWRNFQYEISAELDKNLIDIMKTYPIIDESGYITAPFSRHLENSLLPQLELLIKDKSTLQQLEILASFTRAAFSYKEDEDYFGRSKPMIREEVFYYPFSDCEDRSAVFFGLVEELLHLPMLVIAFSDHLTVAVAVEQAIGPPIRYKGRNYYICDPTGPSNSNRVGNVPRGYEGQSFEILMESN